MNISKDDNSLSLDLVRSVAPIFRISEDGAEKIIAEVTSAVRALPELAKRLKLPAREISLMKNAFSLADSKA